MVVSTPLVGRKDRKKRERADGAEIASDYTMMGW